MPAHRRVAEEEEEASRGVLLRNICVLLDWGVNSGLWQGLGVWQSLGCMGSSNS